MNLTNKDYITILKYYKKPISQNKHKNKLSAEYILASKLCRCIKKVSINNDNLKQKAIGICSNNIFKRHNLKYSSFSCKKGYKLKSTKQTKRNLSKTGKLMNY